MGLDLFSLVMFFYGCDFTMGFMDHFFHQHLGKMCFSFQPPNQAKSKSVNHPGFFKKNIH